ncbi:MAG TPA: hypothetical protein VJ142_00445 [Candidatus Nanoarchaeia archaeon]|nr:hypothetical protein [Candidatus Nanoarchaeia archaeon]
MVVYEAIFAVKGEKLSHIEGNKRITTPAYSIARRQFNVKNESEAREKCREEKQSIEDCFTDVRTLSLSTVVGLTPPKYNPW